MNLPTIVVLSLTLLLASCANTKMVTAPNGSSKLASMKTFYVERHPKEDWGFHQTIADEIAMRGLKATAGEAGGAPQGVDGIVTYDDKWYWDITMYLLSLDIRILDPHTRSLVAKATTRRPSLQRRSPKTMARETLQALFSGLKKPPVDKQTPGGGRESMKLVW